MMDDLLHSGLETLGTVVAWSHVPLEFGVIGLVLWRQWRHRSSAAAEAEGLPKRLEGAVDRVLSRWERAVADDDEPPSWAWAEEQLDRHIGQVDDCIRNETSAVLVIGVMGTLGMLSLTFLFQCFGQLLNGGADGVPPVLIGIGVALFAGVCGVGFNLNLTSRLNRFHREVLDVRAGQLDRLLREAPRDERQKALSRRLDQVQDRVTQGVLDAFNRSLRDLPQAVSGLNAELARLRDATGVQSVTIAEVAATFATTVDSLELTRTSLSDAGQQIASSSAALAEFPAALRSELKASTHTFEVAGKAAVQALGEQLEAAMAEHGKHLRRLEGKRSASIEQSNAAVDLLREVIRTLPETLVDGMATGAAGLSRAFATEAQRLTDELRQAQGAMSADVDARTRAIEHTHEAAVTRVEDLHAAIRAQHATVVAELAQHQLRIWREALQTLEEREAKMDARHLALREAYTNSVVAAAGQHADAIERRVIDAIERPLGEVVDDLQSASVALTRSSTALAEQGSGASAAAEVLQSLASAVVEALSVGEGGVRSLGTVLAETRDAHVARTEALFERLEAAVGQGALGQATDALAHTQRALAEVVGRLAELGQYRAVEPDPRQLDQALSKVATGLKRVDATLARGVTEVRGGFDELLQAQASISGRRREEAVALLERLEKANGDGGEGSGGAVPTELVTLLRELNRTVAMRADPLPMTGDELRSAVERAQEVLFLMAAHYDHTQRAVRAFASHASRAVADLDGAP